MLENKIIQWAMKCFENNRDVEPDNDYSKYFALAGIPDLKFELHKNFLKSIFTQIKLSPLTNSDKQNGYLLPSQPLQPSEILFPTTQSSQIQDKHYEKDEIERAGQHDNLALIFLEKYASNIAITGDPNYNFYSFFEAIKPAAAILDCLEKGNDTKPFLFVSADFSGIQDFVYTISSKGALKTLRARSFALELLTEHIVYEILTLVGGKRYYIIFSGGGCFGLLLPNLTGIIDKIKEYKAEVNSWLFDYASEKLYLSLALISCSETELQYNFQKIWQELSEKLDEDKKRKFSNLIDNSIFKPKPPIKTQNEDECQICHRDDMSTKNLISSDANSIKVCENCYHLFHIGDNLTQFSWIYKTSRQLKNKHFLKFPCLKKSFSYYQVENSRRKGKHNLAFIKNSWDIEKYDHADVAPLLFADYVRSVADLPEKGKEAEREEYKRQYKKYLAINAEPNMTASFIGLANSSCGADLIGALRMDVDNLGLIFSRGLGQHFNLVTLSELSKSLNMFFKVYLNEICGANFTLPTGETALDFMNKNYLNRDGRNVSVIYAGGDDLFIVGAWDEITELSFDIYRCFKAYTCKNDDIGISGGLTLHQPDFPLYQIARLSGEAEHEAKMNYDDDIRFRYRKESIALYYNRYLKERQRKIIEQVSQQREDGTADSTDEGRRISLCMKWKDFKDYVYEVIMWFDPFINRRSTDRLSFKADFPAGFSFKLLEIIEEWQDKGTLFLPYLMWLIQKSIPILTNVPNSVAHQIKLVKTFRENKLRHLHVPLTWIEYLKRGGQ